MFPLQNPLAKNVALPTRSKIGPSSSNSLWESLGPVGDNCYKFSKTRYFQSLVYNQQYLLSLHNKRRDFH